MSIIVANQQDFNELLGALNNNDGFVDVHCNCMCRCANCGGRCGCSGHCDIGKCNCRGLYEENESFNSEVLVDFFNF